MPEYTHEDRVVICQEESLWIVHKILEDAADDDETAWTKRIQDLSERAIELASAIRNYNEQFEVDE